MRQPIDKCGSQPRVRDAEAHERRRAKVANGDVRRIPLRAQTTNPNIVRFLEIWVHIIAQDECVELFGQGDDIVVVRFCGGPGLTSMERASIAVRSGRSFLASVLEKAERNASVVGEAAAGKGMQRKRHGEETDERHMECCSCSAAGYRGCTATAAGQGTKQQRHSCEREIVQM